MEALSKCAGGIARRIRENSTTNELQNLEWVMYTLIRERVASMYELTYVYNLDEMLKLYDLIMMQRDIEYSRSQKERGGE